MPGREGRVDRAHYCFNRRWDKVGRSSKVENAVMGELLVQQSEPWVQRQS